ncbi:dicarboxylate/amino acid:cation symporter [Sphingomonas nostoxanthinifaciens]|uniref:dicarboxylate/amino acid:cation symporter n=1 Tax=Sphingomonas nostoxanthinifaciens TaxID=2872652 RepID=UPI001CC1C259|nr:dicarboxylate/amino acid:cation symporter [Sphingomonas nostoxanthinifaciens]UAK25124.1 dicarboxylate/amino acid:cation symporter [Sphingomonas nostoxanthinifaciens]
MASRLTFLILIAMILGIIVGYAINQTITDANAIVTISDGLSILTDLFLRLIKMIIAPLVFATLVGGIAHMGEGSALGRIGLRTIGWFITASLVSLTLGLVFVNVLRPGVGLALPLPPVDAASGISSKAFNLHDFVIHIVPASPIQAMADNEILQIVVFSAFVGVACTAIGARAAPIVRGVEALAQLMLTVTGYVMRLAPIAVFAAVTGAIAKQGIGILATFGYFMGGFYMALIVLWLFLLGVATLATGGRARELWGYVRDPFLLAFTTASSEAAFPRTLEALEKFGVPERIAGFVLPLGYSFNLDGTMMYCSFATIFIAEAYGIHLSIGQQITMLLLLMVTSKGVAGVPRASLVVIASTLSFFHIPEAGLLLILAVDHFLDMGRSATNVIGNAVAATLVAKWEGVLLPPQPEPVP